MHLCEIRWSLFPNLLILNSVPFDFKLRNHASRCQIFGLEKGRV